MMATSTQEDGDLVERLRQSERAHRATGELVRVPETTVLQAADEIERLRSRVERLEGALRMFLEDPRFDVAVGGNPNAVEAMLSEAREALSTARGAE
jgi:regulator of sirC expression with transglutaminase-like and TPR domain